MSNSAKRKDASLESYCYLSKRSKPDNAQSPSLNTVSWESLPAHILTAVFTELSEPVDLAQCSLVCRYWSDVLRDEVVWKRIFRQRWDTSLEITLRNNLEEISWFSEYKRLHSIQNSAALMCSSVHTDDPVLHSSKSHSEKFLCTTSYNLVAIWAVSKRIEMINVIRFKYEDPAQELVQDPAQELVQDPAQEPAQELVQDPPLDPAQDGDDGEIGCSNCAIGAKFSVFNENDEFLLVGGHEIQLNDSEDPNKSFFVLIYQFPDCLLLRSVEDNGYCSAYGWFGKSTFTVVEYNDNDVADRLSLCSVFEEFGPKELLNSTQMEDWGVLDLFSVDVCYDVTTMQKHLAIYYNDEETVQRDLGYNSSCSHHIGLFAVLHNSKEKEHDCGGSNKRCCIDSKYWSPDPNHFSCFQPSILCSTIGAAIREHTEEMFSQSLFGIICFPLQHTVNGIEYSEVQEMRVYDFKLSLLQAIPMQIGQLFTHILYFTEKQKPTTMIYNDCGSGEFHFFDLHYNLHIRKKTERKEGFYPHNCRSSAGNLNIVLTVSKDNLVEFWDFR